jgi:branched-chain amino acid transport system permease protein
MKIVNFAHGHFVMVAMFISYLLIAQMSFNPYVTLLVVLPAMFLIGAMIHFLVIRKLIGVHEFEQMIATIAVMIILENLANLLFGGDLRGVTVALTGRSIMVGSILLPITQIFAAIGSVVTIGALAVFLKCTFYGNAIRAAADNLIGSYVVGIPVKRIHLVAFSISAALAGIAGVLMLPFSLVSPFVGTEIIVKSFIITIIGGLGSIVGAFVAGILVGVIEALSTLQTSGSYGNAIVFLILIITLIVRPSGLFGGRAG